MTARPPRDRHASTRWTRSSATAGPATASAGASTAATNFRAASGLDLPTSPDPKDRARREYIVWNRARLTELWKRWDAEIRSINPDACFIPNGPPDLQDRRRARAHPVRRSPGAARPHAAVVERPAGEGIPLGDGTTARGRHLQRRPRGAVALEGLRAERSRGPHLGGGRHRGGHAPVVHEVLGRAARHALARARSSASTTGTTGTRSYLRNERSLARVAMLLSEQTATFHGGAPHQERHGDHASGMYHALVEARIPFDMVHEAFLTPERIDRYRVIVLANAAALSDAQCAALTAYVAARRPHRRHLRDVALRRVGAATRGLRARAISSASRSQGEPEGPMRNSYLSLEADPATGRPARRFSTGWTMRPRIINGVWRLPRAPRGRRSLRR